VSDVPLLGDLLFDLGRDDDGKPLHFAGRFPWAAFIASSSALISSIAARSSWPSPASNCLMARRMDAACASRAISSKTAGASRTPRASPLTVMISASAVWFTRSSVSATLARKAVSDRLGAFVDRPFHFRRKSV
jgi:hypothetical protein